MENIHLPIDESKVFDIDHLKVQNGDCLVAFNRLFIIDKLVIVKKVSHLTDHYNTYDFCTNEFKIFELREIKSKNEDYDSLHVRITKIETNEYILMNINDNNELSILDLQSNELKENIYVNIESKESLDNFDLAKKLLNKGVEVRITLKTAAGISIITNVDGQ